MKKRLSAVIALLLYIPAAWIQGQVIQEKIMPVNSREIDLSEIREIRVSAGRDTVIIRDGASEKLIIREYMNKNREQYYARIDSRGPVLTVNHGARPVFSGGFTRHMELYLPASFRGTIALDTSGGNIDSTAAVLNLSRFSAGTASGIMEIGLVTADSIGLSSTSGSIACEGLSGDTEISTTSGSVRINNSVQNRKEDRFRLTSTSGPAELGTIRFDEIILKTTSAAIRCGELAGTVNYSATSGTLEITALSGSGVFRTSGSGYITAAFGRVSGDISAHTRNGEIQLVLPEDLSFNFSAETREGPVDTDFPDLLKTQGTRSTGSIGDSPRYTVTAETRSGAIRIRRGNTESL
ncbi:DUF4097 family beta strand repeat-containing protein [Breznakiella homolactica]|uniref:DUF4097 family beta strand repeat protein n=1 Tax=Breznakiella homolactica TaxID=2798577 RepID=A0A7T7XL95_9SPIR|nr:DUF4097 family beta strand repeat-containing protein [Breznakiella homolactica]QQO08446.1 DUF4097 domain-containing protein [Breznakiella homolactica]